jgi:outer membrane receptor protein involved in Fe transport
MRTIPNSCSGVDVVFIVQRRRAVLASCSLVALTVPPSLHAQVVADTSPREVALPAIIVTGEKSQRSIEHTAPSVKVFTASDLDAAPDLASTRALMEETVNVTSSGTSNLAPAVRGVDGTGPSQGSDAFLAGTRSRLNIQVDGRPATYNEITFGDLGLWDVDQVEVFRGAQSTLQGRNAIAGTIIYKTNDPTFIPEYAGRVVLGSRQQRQVSALASGPLVDGELAYRIALDRQTSDSFVKGYQSYPGVDDPGEFETSSVRGKLLFKPHALRGFSTLVTLAHTSHTAPQTETIARPFGDKVTSYPSMPVFAPSVTSGVVDTTWPLSEQFTLENRLVVGDYSVRRRAVAADGSATIDGHDYTLEPRLRYRSPDKRWTGFVGLYGFSAKQHDTLDLFGGGAWDDRTSTTALYGEATVALRPDLELTAGGRYEREHRRRLGTLAFFTTDFDESYTNFLPKLSLAWQTDEHTTVGAAISRGYNGGNAGFTYEAPYVNYTYKPEYVLNLEGFARKSLQGGRLRLTANVFVSQYKDMQLPFDLNPDPTKWAYVVRNAPRAQTYGAELGAKWQATPALRLNAELGLLHAKVTRYAGSGVEGHVLPRAPKVSTVLGVNWRAPNRLEAGLTARYSSGYYSDITNLERGRVEPGWIANARVSYPMGKARLFAYATNLFDAKRPVLLDADPGAATNAADAATLPRPRTIGVGIEAWF